MDPDSQELLFPPFRLDLANACVWRGEQRIALRPTPFAILHYLLQHPERLITKEEFLVAIWPETSVSQTVLKGYIQQIRKALGDNPREPRFIETVQRRGYRWVGEVKRQRSKVKSQRWEAQSSNQSPTPNPQSLSPRLVGRETALEQFHSWFALARQGTRQVMFVTGEAGIGKTAVIERFLEQTAGLNGIRITHGQCLEHYGVAEPYQPVLEALGRLCRGTDGQACIALLKQYAPTWLAQMPWLLSPTEQEELRQRLLGATRAQMLREMAEAIEILTAEIPLIFVLEDLHWADRATIDLLATIAQRQEAAKLLLIGSYRTGEVIANGHPVLSVKQGLQLHGQCEELALRLLSEIAVEEYLALRFPGGLLPAGFGQIVYQRTEGNPLFLVTVLEDWSMQGVLAESPSGWRLITEEQVLAPSVPHTLQHIVEQQIERLSPDQQRLLEAASIAGLVFSGAAVAAGLDTAVDLVERRCADLVRRGQFLQDAGSAEWPDGTVAGQYRFVHSLYRTVWSERIPAGMRSQLHQKIGLRKECAYGQRKAEIAAELGVHFEAGRDFPRAVEYLRLAGQNAIDRNAHREAIRLLSKGLSVVPQLPETLERERQEMLMQLDLGSQLIITKGWGAVEVKHAFSSACDLSRRMKDLPQLLRSMVGLFTYHFSRAELKTAHRMADELLQLSKEFPIDAVLLGSQMALGVSSLYMGDSFSARQHIERCLELYDAQLYRGMTYILDVEVSSLALLSHALWLQGYPDQALQQSRQAVAVARQLAHPFSLAYALQYQLTLHWLRYDLPAAQGAGQELLSLARQYGFDSLALSELVLEGWALVEAGQVREGIQRLVAGLDIYRSAQIEVMRPCFLSILAEAYRKADKAEEGLRVLNQTLELVKKTGEQWYQAELYRLQGEGVWGKRQKAKGKAQKAKLEDEAEGCYQQALRIARRQEAKSLELRIATSLGRLWLEQGRKDEAQQLLTEVYGWFTEGFETADLKVACALLDTIRSPSRGLGPS